MGYYSNNYAFSGSSSKKSTRRKRRPYRSYDQYKGKSLYTLVKSFAKPGGKIATMYLKKILGLNTELHWFDTIDTNVATSTTWSSISNPLVIPIGDTVNSRTGNSIRGTSYMIKGRIETNTAATAGSIVRVVIVYYPYIHGTSIPNTGVFDQTARITSPYQMGDSVYGNYSILYDRTFNLEVSGQGKNVATFNYVWRPLNWHMKWDSSDTTGALASLINGQVRAFICTSDATANTPNYWCDQRVKFVDN